MAPTGTAPLPPEISQQMEARSPFSGGSDPSQMQQGPGGDQASGVPQAGMDLVRMLGQKIQDLEKWADDTSKLVEQVNPAWKALLMPVAQAGLAMKSEFVKMVQRSGMGKGSPQVPGTPPPNPAQGPPVGSVPQAA